MTQTMIKDTWYVACNSNEVGEKPFGRTVCNEKIVFYRDSKGVVHGLEDFCPHRGAPLSLGFVQGDNLVCGYHGLAMGSEGKTACMPKQRVDQFPCIRKYPVTEFDGFIWVWTGDPSKADSALIPDFTWYKSKEWVFGGGLFNIACDYRLLIDNLMDLSHETYVHATSIGQPEIDETPSKTEVVDGHVITSRFMDNISAPPFWQMAMKENGLDPEAKVDRWQICRFTLPSHIMIEVGVALASKGGYHADDKDKVSTIVVDFITPETDTSLHYFWGLARKFRIHDDELTAKIRKGQGAIFEEDMEMLENQQKNLLTYPDKSVLKLDIDAGGVQARRMIERTIKKETALKVNPA